MQYFALKDQASSPIPDFLETSSVPAGLPTYAILSYNAGQDDASSRFYRSQKSAVADKIAGGKLTRPVVWCMEEDCSLSFPVAKWSWTAGVIADLGI
jgi:hypothetical protein